MAVPTTASGNISFTGTNGSPPYNGIWSIANPGNPTATNESLRDLLAYDWFHGPANGNTVSFYGWGEYTGTSGTAGDSRIYGISANGSNINYKVSDPAGLEYFYDNTSYLINFNATNNLNNNPPFPPKDNNVNISFQFGNPQNPTLFVYANYNGLVSVTSTTGNTTISNSGSSPMINNGFWSINISTSPQFTGTSANGYTLDINGSRYFSRTLGSGANNVTYLYNSGTNSITTAPTMGSFSIPSGSYVGFNVVVTVG